MATGGGSMQGEVTLYHFPGLVGMLGWGWLHPRFLVLEHGTLLVYASEDDWAEHQEPLEDVSLSAGSTVETTREGEELLVKLRCPDRPLLTFCGSSVPAASDSAVAARDDGNLGPDSEAWRKALSREIAKLKREAGNGSQQQQQQQQAGPATAGAAGIGAWRLWNVVSGVFGGGASAATAAETSLKRGPGDGQSDALEEDSDQEVDSLDPAFVGKETDDSDNGEREEKQGRQDTGEGSSGDGGGGGSVTGTGVRRSRKEKGGPRFRRWPLQRGASRRRIPDYDSAGNAVAGRARSTTTEAASSVRGEKGRAGRTAPSLWEKVATSVRKRDSAEREGESGSHQRHQPGAKSEWRPSRCRHECTWAKKRQAMRPQQAMTPAVNRWEYLVGRWIPLQMARSGDVMGVQRFLEKFPEFPDKNNLLRAAVRYKQYSLVEYMLEEQHMDVNLKNVLGMPLVWFSVAFMQRGDSGVMLRYLMQKGADIHIKSAVGQSVLFLLVSSRGKEAIPMLKYLVEECGLSLTDKDDFGSQPLHWAVLSGHLDTVQWISRYTRYNASRANWAKSFERMKNVRLIRPEHEGAARSWRMRGLQKSARSLTPLGVAVLHNHEHIAKWLMGYGTEDPMCIASKRNNLFSEDNRDLALVAKTWPELLPEVLQGFEREVLSTASWDTADKRVVVPTGWRERTYDIKLLYGVPEVPPSRSPLNILLSTDYPKLFEVKAVQMVVALKWSVFGHRYYLWELGRYLVLSFSFILGFIIWGDSANWVSDLDSDDDAVPVIGGTISRLICWALTLYNLFVEEGRELKASKSLRKYLLGGWNLQSVIAYVLVLALMPVFQPWREKIEWEYDALDYTTAGVIRRVMTAPAALFLFTRLMEHLAVWKSTGIFIAVIRMVIADTASWSVLFILFEMAFALAFYALLRGGTGFETVWESMVSVFVMSMGEITMPLSDDSIVDAVAVLIFVVFMLIVAIVYLNLLVAMMTSGYTEVVKGATAQAMMNRAAALVKWEGIMTDKTRREAFRRVAPGRGKRSHITLTGWFGGAATEVFCSEEGATAVEPEQSSTGKRVDRHAEIMKELEEIRGMVERATRHGGGGFARKAPSSDGQDTSFRKRQAGMLDAQGKGLSTLRIGGSGGGGGGGGDDDDDNGGGDGGDGGRRGSTSSVTTEEVEEWRLKARKVQEQANSRRGIVRAQALIRGYLTRFKSEARFLPDNLNPDG
eukprot:g11011.t1